VSRRHLGVKHQGGTSRWEKDEGPHRNGREDWSTGDDIGELAHEVSGGELDSHLLDDLTNGRRYEIRVPRLAAASGKSHVAGPGVAGSLGATDEENRIGIRCEDDGDCGPQERRVVVGRVLAVGQALAEPSEPAG
jgi:hypothetical protein